jgi:hypothetical protein
MALGVYRARRCRTTRLISCRYGAHLTSNACCMHATQAHCHREKTELPVQAVIALCCMCLPQRQGLHLLPVCPPPLDFPGFVQGPYPYDQLDYRKSLPLPLCAFCSTT